MRWGWECDSAYWKPPGSDRTGLRFRSRFAPFTIGNIRLSQQLLVVRVFLPHGQEHDEYVFVTHRRKSWTRSSIQQCLRRLQHQIGLPNDVVLYGLRHHFGTESIMTRTDHALRLGVEPDSGTRPRPYGAPRNGHGSLLSLRLRRLRQQCLQYRHLPQQLSLHRK